MCLRAIREDDEWVPECDRSRNGPAAEVRPRVLSLLFESAVTKVNWTAKGRKVESVGKGKRRKKSFVRPGGKWVIKGRMQVVGEV